MSPRVPDHVHKLLMLAICNTHLHGYVMFPVIDVIKDTDRYFSISKQLLERSYIQSFQEQFT